MPPDRPIVLIRGGGDLASGTAIRLHRAGFAVLITELDQPLALRRLVSFAEAVYAGEVSILVDPEAEIRVRLEPSVIVDARMLKAVQEADQDFKGLTIGLGPGFKAGANCHAVIETQRGHTMGRVIRDGEAAPDSGVPEPVSGYDIDRVLRAPADGRMKSSVGLGTIVKKGELIGSVNGARLVAPFNGALRGLIHDGVSVHQGMKVGDLDPRMEPSHCFLVSDKAFAVGGGVLEAIMSDPSIRARWRG
jgi:xanthine dehydrogenase accessory factor